MKGRIYDEERKKGNDNKWKQTWSRWWALMIIRQLKAMIRKKDEEWENDNPKMVEAKANDAF